jgi:4-amino-4-deoxy-L-arabinose transferase-like glycosyltransferase
MTEGGLARRIDGALLRLSRAVLAVLLVVLALAAFLPSFRSLPPLDRDEARFAQSSRQMRETGDIVDIRFQDGTRYKKPVGIYWMQAAAALTGPAGDSTIWRFRLPSLAAAVASVLMTAAIARLFGGAGPAFVAGVLMAGVFVLGGEARLAKTDAVLLLTVLVAQHALARVWLAERAGTVAGGLSVWLPFWGAMAVSVLVKGPIGPMVVALTALVLVGVQRRVRWLAALRPGAGLILLMALVLPWYVAITIKAGGAFWDEALGRDLLGKVATAQESHGAPPGSYLAAVWVTFFPASVALALSLPAIWRHRASAGVIFALAWTVPGWLVFEATSTKLIHYVLPMYPALALAVGLVWAEVAGAPARVWQGVVAGVLLAVPVLILAAIGVWAAGLGPVPWMPLVLGAAGVLAGAAGFFAARARGLAALSALALWLAGAGFAAGVFGAAAGMPALWPAPQIVALAPLDAACPARPIADAGFGEASLIFLSPAPVLPVDVPGAAQALAADACATALVPRAEAQDFRTEATARQVAVQEIGGVTGLNLGTGRPLDLVLFGVARD